MKSIFSYLVLIATLLLISKEAVLGQTFLKNFQSVDEMIELGGEMLFVADDGIHGQELWKTDGTREGTVLVKDIAAGSRSSFPSSMVIYKGLVYFSAFTPVYGSELWRTDGTTEGTIMLKNISPDLSVNSSGSMPKHFVLFQNELYFTAADEETDYNNIWKTDGTENGTVKVYDTEYSYISNLRVAGNHLYFLRRLEDKLLWKLDGGTGEVESIEVDDYYNLEEMNVFNNSLYFITHTSYRQNIRFYHLNPQDNRIILLGSFDAPTYGSIDIDNFTQVNKEVFFSVRTDFDSGTDSDILWKTDGTAQGTVGIEGFDWQRHYSEAYMQNFISLNDELYFRASAGDGFNLWKSDGTKAGTSKVYDVSIDEYVEPVAIGNKIYFASSDSKLWESDGTAGGTKKIAELQLGTYTDPTKLFSVNGTLYFKANDEYGLALWNNIPNSEIDLFQGYRSLRHQDLVEYISKVDSVAGHSFTIQNLGNKELSVSGIEISGSDFYLEGELPQFISPNAQNTFKVLFFPHKAGKSNGTLWIYTNDLNEGAIAVQLVGNAEGNPKAGSAAVDLVKEIVPGQSQDMSLSNRRILENSSINTTIGTFSIPDTEGEYQYSLISGVGDRDNHLFTIDGDVLKSARTFDHELNAALSIRVTATNRADNSSMEQAFVIHVSDKNEDVEFDACAHSVRSISYSLNDLKYLDENTIIAAGSHGYILKSTDGGNSWKEINIGLPYLRLVNISFPSPQVGFIMGDQGIILKTENAGDDWFPLELPKNDFPYPRGMHFVTKDVGFVFGPDGNIIKTTDGGKSWSSQRHDYYDDYIAAYFFNENKGFICGGSNTLKKTNDGGASWETINMEEFGWSVSFVEIKFLNDQVGFISGSNGAIIKTTDGGKTWNQVSHFPGEYATSLHFLNENEGYGISGGSWQPMYKTTDGGLSWEYQDLGPGKVQNIGFSPSQENACVVGKGSNFNYYDGGRMISTKKNGGSWQQRTYLDATDFRRVFFVSDEVGFAFGDAGYKTTDGGITWLPISIGNTDPIVGAQFFDANTGFVADRYDVFKTSNGGQSWIKLDQENVIDATVLDNLYFINENLGFVFGWDGYIYRTTTGGSNWTKIKVTDNSIIRDMVFLDDLKGFAVTAIHAQVLRTLDGGVSWEPVWDVRDEYNIRLLNTIVFTDAHTGIAAGDDSFILRTDDGGNTWREIKTGLGIDFHSIAFVDQSKGYAATSGFFYETTDGGYSWQPSMSETFGSPGSYMWDLHIVNDVTFAVGSALYKISETASPVMPGYISGEQQVAANIAVDYSIPQINFSHFTWSASGRHKIRYSDNKASITWLEPGTHKITVLPYNSCHTGVYREITVVVDGLPNPEISGPDSVASNAEGIAYETPLNQGSRYSWSVEGAKKFTASENALTVDWGGAGTGKIHMVETRNSSGARQKASMEVMIIGSGVTGILLDEILKSTNLFPNPTTEDINLIFSQHNMAAEIQLKIIDVSGKVYKQVVLHNSRQVQIDVRELPKGLYIFELQSGEQRVAKRVIKL